MLTSPDFKELLSLLKKNNCRYLIIGGYAVMKYAEPRFTKDIDLLVSIDTLNAKMIYQTLKEFGAPLKGLSEKDFMKEGYFYQMGNAPLRIDILMSVPGVEFEKAWQRREVSVVDGVEMIFISKLDLIKSKKAAGRPQDLIDLKLLGNV